MIRLKKLYALLVVLFLIVFPAGCGNKTTGVQKIEEKPDLGSIVDDTYNNEYFGFSIEIPKGWQVQDNETKRMLSEKGTDLIAGENQNQKKLLDQSKQTTFDLLAMFKHPLGTPVTYNPSFAIVAEKINHLPGIKNGKDYLKNVKLILENADIQYEFPKDIYSQDVHNVPCDILEAQIDLGSIIVNQKYYSTIIKGYAFNFVISYSNQEELDELNEIIKSIAFK